MKSLYLLFFVTFFTQLSAQDRLNCYYADGGKQPVNQLIDVQHLKADISIDAENQIVTGSASYTFKTIRSQTDSIVFDARECEIKAVKIAEIDAKFIKKGSTLIVYPTQKLAWHTVYKLVFRYEAHPTDGLHFSGWNDPKGLKRKQIWAHSLYNWMPFPNVKHDILTSEFLVKFDKNYKVYSNGKRLGVKDNKDGTKTWHYKISKPHVTYLIALVIGDYKYKTLKSKSGVPLELWYYPDREDHFEPTYQHSAEMIDFLEKELGTPYPWALYRQAPLTDYLYGAMETTTATVFGDFLHIDKRGYWGRNYINVNAHELTHQWFGNYVSHLNNRHTWLTENFATYYGKLFEKQLFGEDYYQKVRKKELEQTLAAAKSNNRPIVHSNAGTARWYPKGSLVLDMLRYLIGDEEFKYLIKYYLQQNAHQVAESNDFLKAIREATGRSMNWFFEQWYYHGGEPHYQVNYQELSDKNSNKKTVFQVEQIHRTDNLVKYFKMPIVFEVHYTDGTVSAKKTWVEGKHTRVEIPNLEKKEVDFVLFDPQRHIIKKLTFKRSLKELLAQALRAKHMIDRYDALLELRKFSLKEKQETLLQCYEKETFHLTKAEIISQLNDYNNLKISKLLKEAMQSNDAFVRRAVVENMQQVPFAFKTDYEKLLRDSDYINLEKALVNLCDSYPDETLKYLNITKEEIGWRGMNIRMAWLEIAINSGLKEYIPELVRYSGASYDFEERSKALQTLKRLNYLNDNVIENIFSAYLYWNHKLSGAAKGVFKYFWQQNKHRKAIENYYFSRRWTDAEQKKINRLFR